MSRIEINETLCKGCGLCVTVCPRKIIALQQDKLNIKGFHPAGVEQMDRCIGCAFCATICPDSVIEVWKEGGRS
ncbi:MAG: 4Fe-4S dicluster domain-containing protein [Bacillota bacterium]|nr:4Fe-4S dicluster domain-containing protein [Bacillota bacterium]